MIIRLEQLSHQAQTVIKQFLHMRPVPQVPAWVGCAEQLKNKGLRLDAAVIMDLITAKYDRETARKQWKRFSGIDVSERGKGHGYAGHGLALGYPPVCMMGELYSAVGERITRCHIIEGWKTPIDLDPARKTGLRLSQVRLSSAAFRLLIAVDDTIYTEENGELKSLVTFDQKIIGLSEGLNSGEVLVLKESVAPILAPDCVLLRGVDDKVEVVELPNIEQTLMGDCAVYEEGWMTCGGGMQDTEVRFIHADGSWETKFAHESRVLRVARSEKGTVSVDASGQAFLWKDEAVCDDCHFAVDKLPQEVLEKISEFSAGVDWKHKKLYLCGTGSDIQSVSSWCVTADQAVSDQFVRQIYPSMSGLCVALLGDGRYHFWNMDESCVVSDWQLPESMANADEWRTLLDNRFRLSVDDDPRIRRIVLE